MRKNQKKSEKSVWIPINKLGIDKMNIRGGVWITDEELIESIKKQGFIQPLVVRKAAKNEKVDYTVVSGSRRFKAAIEAGLKEVPCIIKELTDVEAKSLSLQENLQRKNMSTLETAESIKDIWNMIQGSDEEKMNIIKEKTGLAEGTIKSYLDMAGLPFEVKELMKPAEERSGEVKKIAEKLGVQLREKEIDWDLAKNVATLNRSDEEKFEAAAILSTKDRKIAREAIKEIRKNPNLSPKEIFEQKIKTIPSEKISLSLEPKLMHALDKVCMERNITYKTLIEEIIKDWLNEKGYL